MKKKIFAIVLAALLCSSAVGCADPSAESSSSYAHGSNKQWFDTTLYFGRAIIRMPDGTCLEGEVQSWTDYEDGDQIQVKIDGKTYLVHSSNICLISE